MLQKILVVVIGLVMSVIGALSPQGLFASNAHDGVLSQSVHDVEQTLATVRAADGLAFAKVNVLWVEVDGRRVTDDAWGTGEVKDLKFKVGVKDIDGVKLSVGDKVVPLHPTDVLTIKTFRGDFAYRDMGTPDATLQLQGGVQTTTLKEGSSTNRLQTVRPGTDGSPALAGDPSGRISYVVLSTGQQVDTVGIETGGQRLFTEEAPTAQAARNSPGNLLAKWVKIDGKVLREYTWGQGTLSRIEFEPADATAHSAVLQYKGAPTEAASGSHVVIRDFVGEYLAYQVQGGLLRLKLDGYAEDFTTGPSGPDVTLPTVPGLPIPAFDLVPSEPHTTDLISFKDRSTDDGAIVFWRWDFGDGTASASQDPTHRFAKPGAYNVKLNVTDDDLHATEVSRVILVKNTNPTVDFEFMPKLVTTDSLVTFTDLSVDPDGVVANWTWDFGDGTQAFARHPIHQYHKSGPQTVTLTVTDELGGRSVLTKDLVVRNHPPIAGFDIAPLNPTSRNPVTFSSVSTDHDGQVVSWAWEFDGVLVVDNAPTITHTFRYPGIHTVKLTVTDDGGASDSVSAQLSVENRAPIPDFDWDPKDPTPANDVAFTNLAHDDDGLVVLSEWDWGDGTNTTLLTGDWQRDAAKLSENAPTDVSAPFPPNARHHYSRQGHYEVTLCVTDNRLAKACTMKGLDIGNSSPIANLTVRPSTIAFRGQSLIFDSRGSYDPDGDPIDHRTLDFGDLTSTTRDLESHTYTSIAAYTATLRVYDPYGHMGITSRTIFVKNAPPDARMTLDSQIVYVNGYLHATGTATDPDGAPDAPLNYTWTFTPTGDHAYGPQISRLFKASDPPNMAVSLVVTDADGGVSNTITRNIEVRLALPTVVIDAPPKANLTELIRFVDRSTTLNGGITSRTWDFGDASPPASDPTTTHAYTAPGLRTVRLTVTDEAGQQGTATRDIYVNTPPTAQFAIRTDPAYQPGQTIRFDDLSTDPDGANTIIARHWDFGDGTFDTSQTTITHAYAQPGTYSVALVAEDDNHARSAPTVATIVISNRPPVAAWHILEHGPYAVGQPLTFISDSSDPDGTPLSYTWSWGDGSSTTTGTAQPTHAFPLSGRFLVTLVVSDGALSSAINDANSRYVHVGADHDLTVDVSAVLPYGDAAVLTNDDFDVAIQHAPSQSVHHIYGKAELAPTLGGQHLQLTIPGGDWGAGDLLIVTFMDKRFMSHPEMWPTITLADSNGRAGPLQIVFDDKMPIKATAVAVAEGRGILGDPAHNARGEAVYHNLTDVFHGVGEARYIDGTKADPANVHVQIRFLPGDTLVADGELRDMLPHPSPLEFIDSNSVIGWCDVQSTIAINGTFAWTAGGDSGCLAQQAGLSPVGHWQVRAFATHGFSWPTSARPTSFYVDPTGFFAQFYLP